MGSNKIKVMGKDMNVGFNFAVVLEYEESFGQSIRVEQTSDILKLFWAVLKAMNDDWDMSLKEMSMKMSAKDFNSLKDVILPKLNNFFNIPAVAEEHVEEGVHEGDEPVRP